MKKENEMNNTQELLHRVKMTARQVSDHLIEDGFCDGVQTCEMIRWFCKNVLAVLGGECNEEV